MNDSLKNKLANYGRWTYRGAWALEISAALIGLVTGLALGYQAFSNAETGSVTSIDLALASAPFLMVAIAELTKIPVATLLFSSSWYWKPIVLILLMGLAGITFETVFMGMERAATLRQLRYEGIVNRIQALELERKQIDSHLSNSESTDLLKKAGEALDGIQRQADQERAKLETQILDVERELEGARLVLPGSARLRDARSDKEAQLSKLASERDTKIREEIISFERQRDSYVERIANLRRNGETEVARRYEEELSKLANPRRRIELQFQPQIARLETDISNLKIEFEKLQANSPPMSTAQRSALNSRRDELRQRQQQVDSEWEDKRSVARKQFDDAQILEAAKQRSVEVDQKRKDTISLQMTEAQTQRIELARTDQIRRIAARFYGVRPELATEDQAGFISVLWFGSLAMLAALAGPLTAIVALSLQKIGSASDEYLHRSSFTKLVRRLLITWRWKRTKTIKIPIEVPVEKIVEKRIEVPVETVVKEILYVPVLTDDPEALQRTLKEKLPADVADLVSINFRGKRNASPA